MKKIISVLLVCCLLSACCVTLASCGHECTFSSEWLTDETSHWHACTGEECEEISDKADHTWNDGEITTKPTQEADGVKTFTCTVCELTRTEPVEFTGMSEDEWNTAFGNSAFENLASKQHMIMKAPAYGVTIIAEATYKFTKDLAWMQMIMGGETQEEFITDKMLVEDMRSEEFYALRTDFIFADFQYDGETKSYVTKSEYGIYIEELGSNAKNVSIKFIDGKLSEIKLDIAVTQDGILFDTNMTMSFYDYGAVVLTLPSYR